MPYQNILVATDLHEECHPVVARAQALAIVVGNPVLFHTPVTTVENMAKVNVLARLA